MISKEALAHFSTAQINAVQQLSNEGASVPFIARYRKERTSGLDEVQIQQIIDLLTAQKSLEARKLAVTKSLDEQGLLDEELKTKIQNFDNITLLEDFYLPYKPKRKTKASLARELGLEPLAGVIMKQEKSDLQSLAQRFVKGDVKNADEALEGARHIMAEWINERAFARKRLRGLFLREAKIKSKIIKGQEESGQKYRDYFKYEHPISKTPGYRLLAILRGEREKFLRVSIGPIKEEAIALLNEIFVKGRNTCSEQVEMAVDDAYTRLLKPSLETETRQHYLAIAEEQAIDVFAGNLEQLLMAAPLGQKRVLALDPGFRTGCKVVCLDEVGGLMHNSTIFPHPPKNDRKGSMSKLENLIEAYKIEVIAVGDGTAGRETMAFIKDVVKYNKIEAHMVNEAGASIYSASSLAREEFPDYDVTVRGAVSIGRRLMDPLSELVKIDPKSIGVGQYQHDVNQKRLKERLDQVVERCVNRVGVNLNLASEHLLQHISGLSKTMAKNIIEYRSAHGNFSNRQELLKVKGLGAKAFEQAAGFLRINNGDEALDNTGVHPERYDLVLKMLKDAGKSRNEIQGDWMDKIDLSSYINEEIGLPTLLDISDELKKPGRDPRGNAKQFEFASFVKSIEDLKEGLILPGKVSNITHFGAFVDIGVKQDGLVHLSQLADRYVSDPLDVVRLGQEVRVKVLEVDASRKRIQLTMRGI
ncbi:MAG: RNA-binding transcriptional accessory protein [Flavobacteriaceae bacterium]|nr:RNA-binding transcriptional accessory protein [Flavobacteriaceae bacterium]